MKKWSPKWKSSKSPRKQRKYRYNAPLHVKRKFLSVHLSKELRKKYGKRAIPVRKGDEVVVMRGKYKKMNGKVSKVDIKEGKVYIEGITRKKVAGTEIPVKFEPSNLMITNVYEDKMRFKTKVEAK
jgi:large subunit ribosomal protein L24